MPVGPGVGLTVDPIVGPGVGTGVGLSIGPRVGPTVATSSHTSLMHNIYSNHLLYYLASLTCWVGDSRMHHPLPNQPALYITVHGWGIESHLNDVIL